MYIYKVTFLGGSTAQFRANSPRECYEKAGKQYNLEVVFVKFLR